MYMEGAMKAKNVNSASRKTCQAIKRVFAEMLSEKKELNKITVSELCRRAGISRGAFYTHYDDIYGVAQDYENEWISAFSESTRLASVENPEQFVDVFFEYVRKNGENYRLLCRSNDFLLSVKKLASFAAARFLELCYASHRLQNKQHIELEIRIFVEGLLCEYVRYCRGSVTPTPEELYTYIREWVRDFAARRFVIE